MEIKENKIMHKLYLSNNELENLLRSVSVNWARVDKILQKLDSMSEQEIAQHDYDAEMIELDTHDNRVVMYSRERHELEQLQSNLEQMLREVA